MLMHDECIPTHNHRHYLWLYSRIKSWYPRKELCRRVVTGVNTRRVRRIIGLRWTRMSRSLQKPQKRTMVSYSEKLERTGWARVYSVDAKKHFRSTRKPRNVHRHLDNEMFVSNHWWCMYNLHVMMYASKTCGTNWDTSWMTMGRVWPG